MIARAKRVWTREAGTVLQRVLCEVYGFAPRLLLAAGRGCPKMCEARTVLMAVAFELGAPVDEAQDLAGRSTRTAVYHARPKVDVLVRTYPDARLRVRTILAEWKKRMMEREVML